MEDREFSEVYRRWYRPLLLYACALTRDQSSAEDLVQNAFMKALLSYHGSLGGLKAWLTTVLRNEFISNYRREKHFSDSEPDVAAGGDPLEQLMEQEHRSRVCCVVLSLPEKYRDVLLQSVVLELSDREIADLHKITVENVRKLRSRAREKVREQMKKEDAP